MRFKITWQNRPFADGADGYKVSIPNYEGGEVVTLDEVQQIEAERDRLRAALQMVLNYREGRGEFNLSRLPAEERASEAFDQWQLVEQAVRIALTNKE